MLPIGRPTTILHLICSWPSHVLYLPSSWTDGIAYRYTFKNIRFAAPPVGDLRWAKPAPPQVNKTIQDGSYGPKCVQTAILGLNFMGSGNNSPIGAAVNQLYVSQLSHISPAGSPAHRQYLITYLHTVSAAFPSRSLRAATKTACSLTSTSREKHSRIHRLSCRSPSSSLAVLISSEARTRSNQSCLFTTDLGW